MTIPSLELPTTPPYCPPAPPSAERIAENNALLAAFEAVTDHAGYWPAYGAVQDRRNNEYLNGRSEESERIRIEMNRINRALKPMLNAQVAAIRTYSTAELMARAATPKHEVAA